MPGEDKAKIRERVARFRAGRGARIAADVPKETKAELLRICEAWETDQTKAIIRLIAESSQGERKPSESGGEKEPPQAAADDSIFAVKLDAERAEKVRRLAEVFALDVGELIRRKLNEVIDGLNG